MPTHPSVSVIVPTFNRSTDLKKCLESLTEQTYRDFEIIVIDDGSTDETPKLAQTFKVRLIRNERNMGLRASWNRGVENSDSQFVAFTDDDAIPNPDWLEKLMSGFVSERVAVTTGKVIPKSLTNATRVGLESSRPDRTDEINPERESIQEANSAFRRDTLIQVGLFQPGYTFHLGVDICLKLKSKGYTIRYVPDAIVRHDYARNLRHLMRKRFLIGKDRARIEKEYGIPLRWTQVAKSLAFITFPFQSIAALFLIALFPSGWSYLLASALFLATAMILVRGVKEHRSLVPASFSVLAMTSREYGYLLGKIRR